MAARLGRGILEMGGFMTPFFISASPGSPPVPPTPSGGGMGFVPEQPILDLLEDDEEFLIAYISSRLLP